MVYEFRNQARLLHAPNQESVITIEAKTKNEAEAKLVRYLRYGREIRFYDSRFYPKVQR